VVHLHEHASLFFGDVLAELEIAFSLLLELFGASFFGFDEKVLFIVGGKFGREEFLISR
jgi:hypothetical protein